VGEKVFVETWFAGLYTGAADIESLLAQSSRLIDELATVSIGTPTAQNPENPKTQLNLILQNAYFNMNFEYFIFYIDT